VVDLACTDKEGGDAMTGRSEARDGWQNRLVAGALSGFEPFWRGVQRSPRLAQAVNVRLIDRAAGGLPARPDPFSTLADYTSWTSLTDRSWDGRHLPATADAPVPALEDVTDLFRRGSDTVLCEKSTVLFAYFAQWATDGFLRSERPGPYDEEKGRHHPEANPGRNEATHEIDLCQIYGVTRETTLQLREHKGGRLKSQVLNGEEFPPHLYDAKRQKRFSQVRVAREEEAKDRWADLFAIGTDTGNVQLGHVLMNVLFLREHNRIARELQERYRSWDDERLFETARAILIAIHLRVVVEEYINHITPYHFRFRMPAIRAFRNASWFRPNRMTSEFNLLYRWHSLIPSTLTVGEQRTDLETTLFNPRLAVQHGLGRLFEDASLQRAGRVGLFNTDAHLVRAERATIAKARALRIASYNDYRELCGFPRVTAFDQISGSARVQDELRRLYGSVDRVEFYPGLCAEDTRRNSVLPSVMGRMVGVDAFSQALTNPSWPPACSTRAPSPPTGCA